MKKARPGKSLALKEGLLRAENKSSSSTAKLMNSGYCVSALHPSLYCYIKINHAINHISTLCQKNPYTKRK